MEPLRWQGLPDVRARIAVLSVCLATALACNMFTVQPTGHLMEGGVNVRIESAKGGTLALADGATLEIPPVGLAADGEVSLRRVERGSATGGEDGFTIPVGGRYEVDLGGQDLRTPATLEIPFVRSALPPGEDPQHVFLTYFDEARGEWVFAGGEVDLARNVVVMEVDHASWWEPATWNWEAWAAALNGILSANIVSIIEGVAVLLDDCPQEGQYVSVDASGANGLIQGCVEHDDAQSPELRIVNPRGIYVEVVPMAGWAFFEPALLAPGESLRFQADTVKPSPFVVSADVTQRAAWRLVIHMTIAMLPGFNQLGFQGQTIACLTERLADVSYLASATDALVDGNGAAAIEHIGQMYFDEDTMRRFITGVSDCDYGPAATWSLPGIRMVGASLATIQSSIELIHNLVLASHGEVAFAWSPQAGLADASTTTRELQLLQACLNEGYVCIPLPYQMEGRIDWLRGVTYDPAWEGEEGKVHEYLGLNPELGTVILAPFGGLLSNLNPGGFDLTVQLPSGEQIKLSFHIAGYHEFTILAEDETYVSAGDALARYERVVQWDPTGAMAGPDFEYPGIIQVATGYGGYSADGLPIYPLIRWDPQVNVDPQRDVEQMMVGKDCKATTYLNAEAPTAIFGEVIDLLHRSGIQVDPEPTGYMDLSPPLAFWPPKVSHGSANTVISGEGDARYTQECVFMQVWDVPLDDANTIVYESTAEGGAWRFVNPLKRFIVWSEDQ